MLWIDRARNRFTSPSASYSWASGLRHMPCPVNFNLTVISGAPTFIPSFFICSLYKIKDSYFKYSVESDSFVMSHTFLSCNTKIEYKTASAIVKGGWGVSVNCLKKTTCKDETFYFGPGFLLDGEFNLLYCLGKETIVYRTPLNNSLGWRYNVGEFLITPKGQANNNPICKYIKKNFGESASRYVIKVCSEDYVGLTVTHINDLPENLIVTDDSIKKRLKHIDYQSLVI
jgi:hypothetical protein